MPTSIAAQRRITVAEIREKVAAYERTVQLVKAARAQREGMAARAGLRPHPRPASVRAPQRRFPAGGAKFPATGPDTAA